MNFKRFFEFKPQVLVFPMALLELLLERTDGFSEVVDFPDSHEMRRIWNLALRFVRFSLGPGKSTSKNGFREPKNHLWLDTS